MTTSHKPTYHPAIGSAHSGGFRYHAPRKQMAVGQLPSHTKLKVRQIGQNAPEELAVRDIKAELEERERQHYDKINLERKRQGLLPYAEQTRTPAAITDGTRKRPREEDGEDGGGGGDGDGDGDGDGAGDGDGRGEEDGEPAAPVDLATAMKQVDWSKIDDADDSDGGGDDDDDEDDDEDEEAELRRELEKIKKEREEERLRKEAEEAAEKAGNEEEQALRGNPLLLSDTFAAARRWDEDVVFRNQSRGEIKHKKRFVNDTIRSDFHRNFIRKYIQ